MAWILFLSITGLFLIFLELFLPGIVLGVAGTICIVAASVMAYVEFGATHGNLTVAFLIVASSVLILIWTRLFPKSKTGRMLITETDLAGNKSASLPSHLENKEGKSHTKLRPAGIVIIDGQRYDATAESGFIEANSPIKIVRVEGSHVVVRKI